MTPKGSHQDNRTREESSAKVRNDAVTKLEDKGYDADQSKAVGPALQRGLRENA